MSILQDISQVVGAALNFAGQFRTAKSEEDLGIDSAAIGDWLSSGRVANVKERAANLTMFFPVLMSESISARTAGVIFGALENEYANMMRLVIANQDIVEIDEGKVGFARKFHTNVLRNSSDLQRVVNQMSESGFDIAEFKAGYPSKFVTQEATGIDSTFQKKLSAKTPTMITVELFYRGEGDKLQTTKLEYGVKATPHIVGYSEVIENVARTIRNKDSAFTAIRWSEGEVKFFRDIMIEWDDLVKEARARFRKDKDNVLWGRLASLQKKSNLLRLFRKSDFIPNATLVMEVNQVEELKRSQGIDIMGGGQNVNTLMDALGLIEIGVVDEARGLYLGFDRYKGSFETWTLEQLQNDNSSANEMRDIIKLMATRR